VMPWDRGWSRHQMSHTRSLEFLGAQPMHLWSSLNITWRSESGTWAQPPYVEAHLGMMAKWSTTPAKVKGDIKTCTRTPKRKQVEFIERSIGQNVRKGLSENEVPPKSHVWSSFPLVTWSILRLPHFLDKSENAKIAYTNQ
jgi:hypothetical protein